MSSDKNRRGIAAMLMAAGVFSLMDTGIKLLSPHYPAIEVVVLRSLASLPLVVAYIAWRARGCTWRRSIRSPAHYIS